MLWLWAKIGVYYPKAYVSDTIKVTVSGSSSKAVPAAKLSSVKLITDNQPVIKWKKLSSVTGYQVYRSTKKNSGFKKIASVKAGKQYYYRVRTYKSFGSKKSYGSDSAVKGIGTLKLTAPVIKAGKIKNGIVEITLKKYMGTTAAVYQKKNGKWVKTSSFKHNRT